MHLMKVCCPTNSEIQIFVHISIVINVKKIKAKFTLFLKIFHPPQFIMSPPSFQGRERLLHSPVVALSLRLAVGVTVGVTVGDSCSIVTFVELLTLVDIVTGCATVCVTSYLRNLNPYKHRNTRCKTPDKHPLHLPQSRRIPNRPQVASPNRPHATAILARKLRSQAV